MYFWTWNTEEVLDLVAWMRDFNERGADRLEFTGFDMQTPDVAIQIVLEFVGEYAPDMLESARSAYAEAASSTGNAGSQFAAIVGSFPVEAARGKRVVFDGWIKTEEAQGHAGLWWRVDGPDGQILLFDNMADRGLKGTQDWQLMTIAMDIPQEAAAIKFGALLMGRGKAWFDGLQVTCDGRLDDANELFDFDFEADELQGFTTTPSRAFLIDLDDQFAKSGRQSLRVASTASGPRDSVGLNPAAQLAAAKKILQGLEQSREELARNADQAEVDWVIQNARVVVQYLDMHAGQDPFVRDRSMADNVAWICEQQPNSRIVLWAHNGHIVKENRAMGMHLAERFGDQYQAWAFATTRGVYQAMALRKGLGEHPLQEPPAGSAEDFFRRAGYPQFALDLRKAEQGSPESGWLAEPILFRSIGALAMDDQFFSENLRSGYDAVIYIDETSRARPLNRDEPEKKE
jgi:erythromycin esterase-like protein